MRDKGLDMGEIRYFDDSHRNYRGQGAGFFGFRKMFRDYLTKLNVPFYDMCCPALTGPLFPVRFSEVSGSLERYDGTNWVAVDDAASIATGLTAFSGGGQGSGTALINGYNNVTTVAAAGDSSKLPAAVAGLKVTVQNSGANSMDVFPATADSINALAVNLAYKVPAGKTVTFTAISSTVWQTANAQAAPVAVNITATATAAQIAAGYITSTSAAAVSLTLPTATQMAAVLGASQGTIFDFYVDNSAGANTVTVVVGAGITVNTPAITGGATLTVSTANAVAWFRLIFTSATAAKILRIA